MQNKSNGRPSAQRGFAAAVATIAFLCWPAPSLYAQTILGNVIFSPDVTTVFAEETVDDEQVADDILKNNLSVAVSLRDIGNIPQATDVNGYFLFSNDDLPQRQLLSFDTTVELPGGLIAEPRDVVLFDGTDFSLFFDGSVEGIPDGAMVDAVSLVGALLFLSFDTTVALDGLIVEDEDIVFFSTVTGEFGEFFVGSDAGVTPDLDLDGLHRLGGLLFVSFDGSGEIDGISFDDDDVLEFDPGIGSWKLAYDGSSQHVGWAAADLNALHVRAAGDLDGDNDVDRGDLNIILAALNTDATGPDDPRDLDGDGRITVLDARKLVLMCDLPRCAS